MKSKISYSVVGRGSWVVGFRDGGTFGSRYVFDLLDKGGVI